MFTKTYTCNLSSFNFCCSVSVSGSSSSSFNFFESVEPSACSFCLRLKAISLSVFPFAKMTALFGIFFLPRMAAITLARPAGRASSSFRKFSISFSEFSSSPACPTSSSSRNQIQSFLSACSFVCEYHKIPRENTLDSCPK